MWGVFFHAKEFYYSMKEGNLSFELQTFYLKQGLVTRVLWSVMFCCDINIESKESMDSYKNFVYQVEDY